MGTATLDKSAAQYIGWELQINSDNIDLPDDCSLPSELWLKSCWVRHRGILLGQRWYLQSPRGEQAEDAIDLVSPSEIEGSQTVCESFLAKHGYRPKGQEYPDAMEYVRNQTRGVTTAEPSLFEDLKPLARLQLGDTEYRIELRSHRGVCYVSGSPYMTTGFIERAFVFNNPEDATRIAMRHFPKMSFRVIEAKRNQTRGV